MKEENKGEGGGVTCNRTMHAYFSNRLCDGQLEERGGGRWRRKGGGGGWKEIGVGEDRSWRRRTGLKIELWQATIELNIPMTYRD